MHPEVISKHKLRTTFRIVHKSLQMKYFGLINGEVVVSTAHKEPSCGSATLKKAQKKISKKMKIVFKKISRHKLDKM